MSVRRRTSSSGLEAVTMSRSLARSSSVSLVLPLAAPQQKASILYSLRRAHSSIPAVEYCLVSSDLGNSSTGNDHGKAVEAAGNNINYNNGDGEQDSYNSDYTSCNSSIADLFDILDEPQRVSKEILRSVSLSFQWLDLPFQDFDLPSCREDSASSLQRAGSTHVVDGKVVMTSGGGGGGLPVVRQGSVRFAYIHECRTGKSLVSHVELKTAMDSLRHWTMQVPRNCCLSYSHDVSGDVATLPWPDLEAGGMEEIEDFVSTVNRVEGKPVFFPRYERSHFGPPPRSVSSIPLLQPAAIHS